MSTSTEPRSAERSSAEQVQVTESPPPGWYECPDGRPGQCYWDGIDWRLDLYRSPADIAQQAAATAPAVSPQPSVAAPTAGPSAGLVAAGWVFAILFPLVGLVLGIMIQGQEKGTTKSAGKWITGVSIGMIVLAILAVAGSSGG